jgi:hypothetical protein
MRGDDRLPESDVADVRVVAWGTCVPVIEHEYFGFRVENGDGINDVQVLALDDEDWCC